MLRRAFMVLCCAFIASGCATVDEQEIADAVIRIADAIVAELEDISDDGDSDGLGIPGPIDPTAGTIYDDIETTPGQDDLIPYMTPVGIHVPALDALEDDRFSRWGFWARMVSRDDVQCGAITTAQCDVLVGPLLFYANIHTLENGIVNRQVGGDFSGTTPTSGSAIWLGQVRATTEASAQCISPPCNALYRAVEGMATLTMDFPRSQLDVEFSNMSGGVADMSWESIDVVNGYFMAFDESLFGDFYGPNHEGAAGKFSQGNVRGVFGAIRDEQAEAADTE